MNEDQEKFPNIDNMKSGDLFQQNQIFEKDEDGTGGITYEAGDFFIAAWVPADKRGTKAYKKALEALIELLGYKE